MIHSKLGGSQSCNRRWVWKFHPAERRVKLVPWLGYHGEGVGLFVFVPFNMKIRIANYVYTLVDLQVPLVLFQISWTFQYVYGYCLNMIIMRLILIFIILILIINMIIKLYLIVISMLPLVFFRFLWTKIVSRNSKTPGSNSVNVFLGLGLPWTLGVTCRKDMAYPFCWSVGRGYRCLFLAYKWDYEYTFVYIYIYKYRYIYVYIYRERER